MKEYRRIVLLDITEKCEELNSNNLYGIDDVRGVSNTKQFMKTKANVSDRDFSKFQIVKPDYFVFNRRTTRNGEKIGMGFNNSTDIYICTEDYVVFKIREDCKKIILPTYLYLFFLRNEFDRYARYHSSGSATEFFNWEDMQRVSLLVPNIKEQQKIVDTYNAITNRIQIKQKINENLEKTALLQIEELLENPNTKKRTIKIGDICDVKGGKRLPLGSDLIEQKNSHPYIRIRDLKNSCFVVLNDEFLYVDDETQQEISRYITNTNDLLISIVGTIGLTSIVHSSLDNANLTENCVKLTSMQKLFPEYVLMYLRTKSGQKAISQATVGAVQAKLPLKNVQNLDIQYFDDDQMKEINLLLKNSFKLISCNIEEIIKLNTLRNGIISQISKR